ncbi:Ribosome-binding factor A [invertebrate metagenome]|uniref:Ribosome-binding factor A n=1 Tax=invertebrate metagenome TaxID=1711999 RepID=A0A484H5T1_9ZZZZ
MGEAIRHALSELIERTNFRDPELLQTSLTVTEVRMSPDLRNALVFVVPLGRSNAESLLFGLRRVRPFLRYALGRMVRLQFVPELSFKADTRFEEAHRIEEILRRPDVLRDLQGNNSAGGTYPAGALW